ncbi:MAG: hypothetical protein R3E10_06585 [Gemmatimonadota bacterium]
MIATNRVGREWNAGRGRPQGVVAALALTVALSACGETPTTPASLSPGQFVATLRGAQDRDLSGRVTGARGVRAVGATVDTPTGGRHLVVGMADTSTEPWSTVTLWIPEDVARGRAEVSVAFGSEPSEHSGASYEELLGPELRRVWFADTGSVTVRETATGGLGGMFQTRFSRYQVVRADTGPGPVVVLESGEGTLLLEGSFLVDAVVDLPST